MLPLDASVFLRRASPNDPGYGVCSELLEIITTYVPIDTEFTREAEELAADYFLRGADATYAVVARRYGATLVSLDDEHYRNLSGILTVQTPAEALATITSGAS